MSKVYFSDLECELVEFYENNAKHYSRRIPMFRTEYTLANNCSNNNHIDSYCIPPDDDDDENSVLYSLWAIFIAF